MTMKSGWPEYAIEAALLAAFMVSASAFTILVDHPRGPLFAVIADPAMRRFVVGCAMGITAAALIYSRWGSRSGAHMNPAVTLALATSRGMSRRAVAGYVAAHFAGGLGGMAIAAGLFGSALAHPAVNWVITRPGPRGAIGAFAAELLMTFVLMTVVLWMSNHPRWARRAGLAAAAMVTAFITVEAPLSGMSLNPARTLGPALFARDFTSIWIYFIAPTAGMLMAVAAYRRQCPTGSCPRGLHPTHPTHRTHSTHLGKKAL
jgi:aquaporin Z